MKFLVCALLVFTLLLFPTMYAKAMVYGGSNLGLFGYPDHTCVAPYKPYSFTSQEQLDSYKWEFEEFTDSHQVIDIDQYGVEPSVIKKCVHEIQAKANEIKKELEKRG